MTVTDARAQQHMTAPTSDYLQAAELCFCGHVRFIHDGDRCIVRACGCVRMRPTGEVVR